MRTTSFSIEIFALLILTLIPWPGPSVYKITCSRDNSKIVAKVIQNKWLPVLERFQVKLPLECPFHPARDIFAPQHTAKLKHRSTQWTCAFCGKSFYEESHLDTHFDLRHRSQINKAEDAVCLAEYCDIMRCQVLEAHGVLKTGSGPGTEVEVWRDARRALATAPRQTRTPRRRHSLHTHTTTPPEPVPESKEKSEDAEIENKTAELCDDDVLESSLPPDSRQRRIAELNAARARCDPAKLHVLKLRCETIVHSCISTLLLHLTQHQFTELEEEIQRSVCWYLSCDRYWEDTTPSARAVPWPLLIALATGLAFALCMCYYIIWIVFDSEESSIAGSGSVSLTSQLTPARSDRLTDDPLSDEPDDQYIYVTYPPELKRRLLDSCYNRTTRL